MSSPIPLMLFGKSALHQKACQEIVRPEYEILSTVSSLDQGRAELSSHLSQNTISAVAMGGGFSNADMDEMRALQGAEKVAWLRPVHTRPGAGSGPSGAASGHPSGHPGGPPGAEEIAGRLRRALDEHWEELKGGRGGGETWYF